MKGEKMKGSIWHKHAQRTLAEHQSRSDERKILTPTQERLVGWAEEHEADPDSQEALEGLRNRGFDPEHPPGDA